MVFSADDAWKLTLDAKATPRRIEAVGAVPRLVKEGFWGVYRLEKDKLSTSKVAKRFLTTQQLVA